MLRFKPRPILFFMNKICLNQCSNFGFCLVGIYPGTAAATASGASPTSSSASTRPRMPRSVSSTNTSSVVSQGSMLGDLTSGRAFDSGCTCHDSSEGMFNDLIGRSTHCHCDAPRLQSQVSFESF